MALADPAAALTRLRALVGDRPDVDRSGKKLATTAMICDLRAVLAHVDRLETARDRRHTCGARVEKAMRQAGMSAKQARRAQRQAEELLDLIADLIDTRSCDEVDGECLVHGFTDLGTDPCPHREARELIAQRDPLGQAGEGALVHAAPAGQGGGGAGE